MSRRKRRPRSYSVIDQAGRDLVGAFRRAGRVLVLPKLTKSTRRRRKHASQARLYGATAERLAHRNVGGLLFDERGRGPKLRRR